MESNKVHFLYRLLPTPDNALFTLLVAAVLLWVQSARAFPTPSVPGGAPSTGVMAYQGRLADADGNPITQNVSMDFSLYSTAVGGQPLWTENWPGVQVTDGLFNVLLGSQESISQTVITGNDTLWLGITVGSDSEMAPRVQLGSVPFATQALTLPTAQRVDCFPPPANCCFDLATGGVWSSDLFTCEFTVPTPGIMFLSLQGHQKTNVAAESCSFSIFMDGVNINTAPHDYYSSTTHTTTFHPSHMADTLTVSPGLHTISARIQSQSTNICSLHDPDINGLFIPTQ